MVVLRVKLHCSEFSHFASNMMMGGICRTEDIKEAQCLIYWVFSQ